MEESTKKQRHWRIWVFFTMLILAVVGMALTMSFQDRAWEYWIFLVAFYGLVSITWAWQRAKNEGNFSWRSIRSQLLHWTVLLGAVLLLLAFERTEVISSQAASPAVLLLLALGCLLAGVHFELLFLILGVVLAVMVVSLAYLEQNMVWIVMASLLAVVGFVFFRTYFRKSQE